VSAPVIPDSPWAPDGQVTVDPTGSGPLDGIRVAVKDLYDLAGRVTAAGNPTLATGAPAPATAPVVAALLAAGATFVGKTATDELAMGMFGANSHYGTPPNPAAPDRVPGGSSSGSASAVAGGLADLGLGTDTGGSIRVPGAFCGLAGLRPTHGRLDTAGIRPMAPGFDTVGLLAATPDLVATAFGVLTAASAASRPVSRLVLLSDLLERATPAMVALTRATTASWAAALGLELTQAPLVTEPLPAELVTVFWPLMSRQLWESNGAWVRDTHPVLGEGIEERILTAANVTDKEVAAAQETRERLTARLSELLAGAVAVLPTTMTAAPPRTTPHAQLMAWRDRNLAFVVPASLTGAPQLTLPAGRLGGAPAGVSLLGLPGDDELLLALAGRLA
jgi:amidase